MIWYKIPSNKKIIERPIEKYKLTIDELPKRPIYVFRNAKEEVKFIKTTELIIRKSIEYKDYINFLKNHMDMKRCAVLHNLKIEDGKKYSIEIHHEPFTLFDICSIVLNRRRAEGDLITPLAIADEIMELHYNENVGLIPLTKTIHQLVHDDNIFLPLQLIYHKYDKFYDEYEDYIDDNIKEKLDMKIKASLEYSGSIVSSVLEPNFTYIEVDGIKFPEPPEEWKDIMPKLDTELGIMNKHYFTDIKDVINE